MEVKRSKLSLFAATAVTLGFGIAPAPGQTFQGLGFVGSAAGVGASGSAVAGTNLNTAEAFYWTSAGGIVALGILPNQVGSSGYAISADGSTVVGTSFDSSNNFGAFIWTSAAGMIALGQPNGDDQTVAFGVSGNGLVV